MIKYIILLKHTREYTRGQYFEGFNFISEYFNRFAQDHSSDLLIPIASTDSRLICKVCQQVWPGFSCG